MKFGVQKIIWLDPHVNMLVLPTRNGLFYWYIFGN